MDALADAGWAVLPEGVPLPLARRLMARAQSLPAYRRAAVGRHDDRQLNGFVRRDRIVWLAGEDPAERAWLDWMENLRVALNRGLMLGLDRFESHFAHYPPGAFYRRHFDAFRGESNRIVSVVAYLNPDWTPADGGELVLYDPAGGELGRFPPTLGSLAVYLSECFPHEVLPSRGHRYSLAGWFRLRGALPIDNLRPAPALRG